MKKVLFVLILLLTLGMSTQAVAQKHRHTPRGTELVDTTKHSSAVDAFSDTTTVDSIVHAESMVEWDDNADMNEEFKEFTKVMDAINNSAWAWLAWVVGIAVIILIVFLLLSPIFILILLFFLINRNRKQKVKMAQMAMENGQPIPDQLLETPAEEISDEYQKGLRQCFVGIGLAIFLWIAADGIGFGIGALVFFIGLGKVVAAKTAAKKKDLNDNNQIIQQDYD